MQVFCLWTLNVKACSHLALIRELLLLCYWLYKLYECVVRYKPDAFNTIYPKHNIIFITDYSGKNLIMNKTLQLPQSDT